MDGMAAAVAGHGWPHPLLVHFPSNPPPSFLSHVLGLLFMELSCFDNFVFNATNFMKGIRAIWAVGWAIHPW
jgi:hypothetical protein